MNDNATNPTMKKEGGSGKDCAMGPLLKKSVSMEGCLIPQTHVCVDTNAVAHNIRALKGRCKPGTSVMAVVKANAYGHGAVAVSRVALENGASALAVARISEAVELREAGIDAPILLFGDLLPNQVAWAAENDIRATVTSLETADQFAAAARIAGLPLKVHIKVDTGMGRLGFLSYDTSGSAQADEDNMAHTVAAIERITDFQGVDVEGLYTHFANADAEDKTHVDEQIAIFRALVTALASRGIRPSICHTSNSAATIELPDAHFDMVRPGVSIYGLWPSDEVDKSLIDLKPAMRIISKIIHLKSVPANFKVSYGSTHITGAPTKIATIPIGYADGYGRLLSSTGDMLVRGAKAPIAGRVCMDFTMIDVGHIPDVAVGDEVVIMGRQDNVEISADEIAAHTGTINYEVVSALTGRMPVCYS